MNNPEWFFGWLTRHARRCENTPPHQEPDDLRAWLVVQTEFGRLELSEELADLVTDRIAVEAPTLRAHRKSVMVAARRVVAERAPAAPAAPAEMSDREIATAGCRAVDCECGGHGLLSRRIRTLRFPNGMSMSCYCSGPAGRWLKAQHERDASLHGRIWDLAELRQWRPEVLVDDEDEEAEQYRGMTAREIWDALRRDGPMLRRVDEEPAEGRSDRR